MQERNSILMRAGDTTKKMECEPNAVLSSSVITDSMATTCESPPSLPNSPEPKTEPKNSNLANHRNAISLPVLTANLDVAQSRVNLTLRTSKPETRQALVLSPSWVIPASRCVSTTTTAKPLRLICIAPVQNKAFGTKHALIVLKVLGERFKYWRTSIIEGVSCAFP